MEQSDYYRGRRVLVTGASGFIGGHLSRRLEAAGAELHAVSRREQPRGSARARWHCVDLADGDSVARLVKSTRPQVVFHLAGHVVGARGLQHVRPAFAANLASAVHLLCALQELGEGRLVLAGSLEEPPAGSGDAPSSPYAAAKWAASGYARMFHALYGTPVVTARIFMVYGPAQRDLRKLVPYVTLSLLRGEAPKLSSGSRAVDWIYVEDVLEGLLAMGMKPGLEGATLDLGTGRLETVRTVVELLGSLVASGVRPELGALPDRAMEQVRAADVTATEARLGWRPASSLEQGLERTVAWYRSELESGRLA